MPQNNLLLQQQPEPFLASLFNDQDQIDDSFVKPRDRTIGYLTVPGPVYQTVPVYIPPPGYCLAGSTSPTPSPSPYSEQENDPLYRPYMTKKYHNQTFVKPGQMMAPQQLPDFSMFSSGQKPGMADPRMVHKTISYKGLADDTSKIVHKDVSIAQAMDLLHPETNPYGLDDPRMSPVEFLNQGNISPNSLLNQYRVPAEYYLNDVQCGPVGMMDDGTQNAMYQIGNQLPPHGLSSAAYQSYDGFNQYPGPRFDENVMVDGTGKKMSPVEQVYQQTWGHQMGGDPSGTVFDKVHPYTLAGREDINLATYSMGEQMELEKQQNSISVISVAEAFQSQKRESKGFPTMELHTETTIPNLRGRKNSSFREYQSTEKALPPSIASAVEQSFMEPDEEHVEILNEGGGHLTALINGTGQMPPDMVMERSLDETDTLDKVRTVFMSFVDQSDDSINKMDDEAKTQMFVNVCNMYKSLSVMNIAGSLSGKKPGDPDQDPNTIVVNQNQIQAAVSGEGGKVQIPMALRHGHVEESRAGKRYQLRKPRENTRLPCVPRSPSEPPPVRRPCTRDEEQGDGKCKNGGNTCDFCSKTFPSNSSLKVHMNLHTGDKPHICTFCKRGFGDPSNLKRHLRIHTRSRPYTCHLCPTSFNQSSHLVRHIRSHSQRGCHKSCRFCLATFPHYSNLRRHTEKCSERKRRGGDMLLDDELDKHSMYGYDETYYLDQDQNIRQHIPPLARMKHDKNMNYVLRGHGLENEPFIDLSPVDMDSEEASYMRLSSMKQNKTKLLGNEPDFGMKAGDSNISV